MTECDDDSSRWWVSGRRERRFVGGGGGWKRCSECGEEMKEASIKVI